MMRLAQPSAPLFNDIVYLMNIDSNNITTGWCAQELFTFFFNNLINLKAQNTESSLKQQFETLFTSIFLNSENITNDLDILFYKLIAYTRDIKGLGRYTHGYMLVVELFKFGNKYEGKVNKDKIQNNAYLIFESFVKKYGSWKDIKYFLNYYVEDLHLYKERSRDLSNDFFIKKIVQNVCKQMKEDSNTLIAKWLPREKSNKFGWLTPLFAREYYCEWFSENMSAGQYKAATRKALTHFRQLISSLNKELNTTQTYQCNNNWSEIDFNKNVTKNTMYKQKNAFNCINKMMDNKEKYKDRLQCKINYNNYLKKQTPQTLQTPQTIEKTIKNWDTILKELTNIRYNDLDILK